MLEIAGSNPAALTNKQQPTTKIMTEKQGWAFLAQVFEQYAKTGDNYNKRLRKFVKGICGCINVLENQEMITWRIARRMRDKIKKAFSRNGPNNHLGYIWPPNHEFAKNRAAFCARRAK